MARILILIILVWLLVLIIKRVATSANARPTPSSPEQKIVQCAHCGCHVPISESQIKDDNIICNNPECQNSHGD